MKRMVTSRTTMTEMMMKCRQRRIDMVRTTVLLMKFYRIVTRNYSMSYFTHLVFPGSGHLEFKGSNYGCGRPGLSSQRNERSLQCKKVQVIKRVSF